MLDRIRLRAGQATYRHFELEPSGEIGTAFYNNGLEGRLELVQARRGAWSGATGVQHFNRQFDCETAALQYGAVDREVDLPCFQFRQANARCYGFEADLSATLFTLGTTHFNADVLGDYVHANITDQGPVPRIPAPRVLGGLEAQGDQFTARAEVEHLFDQKRTAAFETPTEEYTVVNASVSFAPFGRDNRTQILLSANNIFDVTAQRAASFLKDFAPLAGRDLRATLRFGL